jgi:O-acetyl-ADP-ribose deacetylase (regulator of RNase III)
MPIHYLKGDATSPQAKGPKLIMHICNDSGKWGAGFVLAVSRRWGRPEAAYRAWYHSREIRPESDMTTTGRFELGQTQIVTVQPSLGVVNMIAQAGTRTGSKGPPIRYDALALCLRQVRQYAESWSASVHAPRIGCGLGGGKWDQVEPLIQKMLGEVAVYVYDYD